MDDGDQDGELPQEAGETAAGVALDANHELMNSAAERMLSSASKATRFVLKRIPGLPGFVYDTTRFLTSDQPLRTAAGIGGGVAGGAAGAALGAAAGGVNAPVGAVLGAAAGENVANDAYDDYYAGHRAQIDATNRWIVNRRTQLFGR